MQWEVVIGLEVHAQLSTQSKIFSAASTAFGAEPNTQTAVVDIALPDGLTTNYGKTLPLTREMKGSAEIITDDLRLLERLIMPLRKIFMEQK